MHIFLQEGLIPPVYYLKSKHCAMIYSALEDKSLDGDSRDND